MLYIIATPIGNLEDLSHRAVRILQECDYVLAEDSRKSKVLLDRYGIEKKIYSFHKFKEKKVEQKILEDLEEGLDVALISDAGTPLIQDPGFSLVQACIDKGLAFTSILGASSVIQALILSGMDPTRFQFIGFLPKKPGEHLRTLRKMLYYDGTSIAFESPQRLVKTLAAIERLDPDRPIAVAREMTKKFEECRRGYVKDVKKHFEKKAPKGEIVLMVGQGKMKEEEIELEELVPLLCENFALNHKEAIKMAKKWKRK